MNIDVLATAIAVLTFFGISAIMALSLNLEYGLAGIPNFGQALFVSIGAYTAGILYTRVLPLLAGQPVIDPCGENLVQGLAEQSRHSKETLRPPVKGGDLASPRPVRCVSKTRHGVTGALSGF